MGVRPPTDDADDEPAVITFGIAALDERLDRADVEFPVTKRELEHGLGDVEIPYDAAGHSVSLSRALERTSIQEFETRQDLLNALHPVFEELRDSASTGLVARLRALLPF